MQNQSDTSNPALGINHQPGRKLKIVQPNNGPTKLQKWISLKKKPRASRNNWNSTCKNIKISKESHQKQNMFFITQRAKEWQSTSPKNKNNQTTTLKFLDKFSNFETSNNPPRWLTASSSRQALFNRETSAKTIKQFNKSYTTIRPTIISTKPNIMKLLSYARKNDPNTIRKKKIVYNNYMTSAQQFTPTQDKTIRQSKTMKTTTPSRYFEDWFNSKTNSIINKCHELNETIKYTPHLKLKCTTSLLKITKAKTSEESQNLKEGLYFDVLNAFEDTEWDRPKHIHNKSSDIIEDLGYERTNYKKNKNVNLEKECRIRYNNLRVIEETSLVSIISPAWAYQANKAVKTLFTIDTKNNKTQKIIDKTKEEVKYNIKYKVPNLRWEKVERLRKINRNGKTISCWAYTNRQKTERWINRIKESRKGAK